MVSMPVIDKKMPIKWSFVNFKGRGIRGLLQFFAKLLKIMKGLRKFVS